MPTVPLPERPSLEQLRNQARELQRSVRAGDAAALALVAEHHPGGAPADPASLPLSAAQLAVARSYGFPSWPALRRRAEVGERFYWNPEPPADESGEDLPDRFARLACLWYRADNAERWARARALLAEHPELTRRDIWAAAAANDLRSVRRLLRADRSLATRRGGPHGWCPLFYLVYTRVDAAVPAAPVLGIARLLLAAGADPDEGYLWHGLPTPFTLLTGVFGHGELGPGNQPPHPHAAALGRLLLEAGADPNDGQTLYNRQFEPDDDHLELLLEFGLGHGDGGPWQARLRDELATPPEMLRDALAWAVTHDQLDRVRLLVEHGAELDVVDADGHTPLEAAALSGNAGVVALLREHGARPAAFGEDDALLAAVMRGDRAALAGAGARALARLRRRPWLLVWAAARGRAAAVELLLELGVDVNAYGRADVPGRTRWQTALHTAAGDGDVELARLLLAAGADPDLRDARFGGTPLDWANHFDQTATAELLAPLTKGDDDD